MGPGGEKVDNLGELMVIVRTEQHSGSDISSRVTFQGAKVRKPLLAVSGVIDKSNTCGLRWERNLNIARPKCPRGFCEKGCQSDSRTHPAAREKLSICLTDLGTSRSFRRRISFGGELFERAEHQAE